MGMYVKLKRTGRAAAALAESVGWAKRATNATDKEIVSLSRVGAFRKYLNENDKLSSGSMYEYESRFCMQLGLARHEAMLSPAVDSQLPTPIFRAQILSGSDQDFENCLKWVYAL